MNVTTSYAYNPMREISSIIDADGNTTSVSYDNLGRRTVITTPDTGKTEYIYDTAGNISKKITENLRASSKSIRYKYTYNRLDRIIYPSMDDVIYDYGQSGESFNRAGRIKSVTNGHTSEERKYGKLGEVLETVRTISSSNPSLNGLSFTTKYTFDSFGRMQAMEYPDGEVLTYSYDIGGLLVQAQGDKGNHKYDYINDISYDRFGQRTSILYGNKVRTNYEYYAKSRRLKKIRTYSVSNQSMVFQNISYKYDGVGNILGKNNKNFVSKDDERKSLEENYGYDTLHRLIYADGSYTKNPDQQDQYINNFVYDNIGNMLTKEQTHHVYHPSEGNYSPKPQTTYTLNYAYNKSRPHAVTGDGIYSYEYDGNGNMVKRKMNKNSRERNIIWDDENRIVSTSDNGDMTYYRYDDAGKRVSKKGKYGEIMYPNSNFTIRNGEVATKHIFAGNTRIVTKVVKNNFTKTNGKPNNGKNYPVEKDVYFYHSDHLGSSNIITDENAKVWEHITYFPYGETWVEEKRSQIDTPYRFTGKELDQETGLYYFGARYYDPQLSRWISADPAFEKYLPEPGDFDTDHDYYWALKNDKNGKLPGMGGVYNPVNLNVYHYAGQNPVKLVDPDGNAIVVTSEQYAKHPLVRAANAIRQKFPTNTFMGFFANVVEGMALEMPLAGVYNTIPLSGGSVFRLPKVVRSAKGVTGKFSKKGFSFRIDTKTGKGGFHLHIFKEGEEVAKVSGKGGYVKTHGGKTLLKPSQLPKEVVKETRKLIRHVQKNKD